MCASRVEACINTVMARHNGVSTLAQSKYFEAVHQELAPLARDLEQELIASRERVKALEAVALQLIRRYVIDLPDYAQKDLDARLARRAAELLEKS